VSDLPVLRLEGITKSFSGTVALSNASLTLAKGEIHALVGENGAGKSTLVKIITGAHRRDSGVMEYQGGPVFFTDPSEAQEKGIAAVYQEIQLVGLRTVAENIFLGREPTRFGFLNRRKMMRESEEVLTSLGLRLDPNAVLGSLPIAHRQMVAIARAVSFDAKVIILDEPTSSLTDAEVSVLFV